MFGGFACLREVAGEWSAEGILNKTDWPLRVVIGITTEAGKAVGSSDGMERSRLTSPFFDAWSRTTVDDFAAGVDAVEARDFERLAAIAESSCLKMHGLMLSSDPGLVYWNAGTVAGIHAVRELRSSGTDVFFTIDAGPQIKAVCLPGAAEQVAGTLATVPGIERTITCGLGDAACVKTAD